MHTLQVLKFLTLNMGNNLTTKLDSEIKLPIKTSICSFSKHLGVVLSIVPALGKQRYIETQYMTRVLFYG